MRARIFSVVPTIIGALFFIPAHAATGSIYPGELIRGTTPTLGSQMVTADFNGDGLTDIAVADNRTTGTNHGGVWVYLAKAGGGYDTPVFYATASQPYTLAAGDLDGDGHPDIVTGNDGSATANQISVLINNGDGTFKAHVDYSPQPTATFKADAVTVGDVNGDGLPDVVLDASDSTVYVIPGSGAGGLNTSAVQAITLAGGPADGYGVAIDDLNGDGVADLVVASGCSAAGTGDTVDVFDGRTAQPFATTPTQSLAVGACPTLTAGDVNADGAPDVIVVNRNDATVQVLLNSAGSLADSGTTYALPAGSVPSWAHLGDLDGDGNPDIVTASSNSDFVSVLYGSGTGSFATPAFVPTGYAAADAAIAEASGDTSPDVVALDAGAGGLVVARNLGGRTFLNYRDYAYQDSSGNGKQAADMASADFNGDGKPDVVMANHQDNSLSVLLNDGKGGFQTPPTVLTSPNASGVPNAVTVGDVNGDGKADIVTADSGGNLNVYLGDGTGNFPTKVTSAIVGNSIDGLALGDLDGDGNPDAVVAENAAAQVQVCKGDGAGAFDCSAFAAVTVGTAAKNGPFRVALSDVNGDGKLDLIVSSSVPDANVTTAWDAYVFLGNGNGSFVTPAKAVLPVFGEGWSVQVGDINGDGKPDLLFGSQGNSVEVFDGNGDGTFGAGATYPTGITGGDQPWFAILADVNGDGHPDIVAANHTTHSLGVLLNDGTGKFGAVHDFASGEGSFPVLALDMSGTGVLDLVAANTGDGSAVNSTVSVYPHNQPPVVQGTSLTIPGGSTGNGQVTGSDPEHDTLTFAVATNPAHGSVTINASTGTFAYTPAAGFVGSDSFTVTDSDGVNISAPAAVSITVTQPAVPTITGPSPVSLAAGTSANVTFNITGGGTLTVTATSSDQSLLADANITGATSCMAAGSCTLKLTAANDKLGTATVTVKVADDFGQSAQSSFDVTVTKPPAPAVSGLSSVTVAFGSSGTSSFKVAGTGPLTVQATSSNQKLLSDGGIAGATNCTVAGTCTLSLSPASGTSGTATVTVTVSDSFGQSTQGSFSFTVKQKPASGGGGGLGLLTLAGLAALAARRRLRRS